MLSELLYKLRGMDKWPTTKATVTSTKIDQYGSGGIWNKRIFFTYTPDQGSVETGKLVANNQTTLYGVEVSDTFDVQYNPRNPKNIYCEEAEPAGRDLGLAIAGIVALFVLYDVVAACIRALRR